jgi:outer membrane receptor protein involved in Fe transport
LLDGKRIVPSTPQGTVDTNMIPSALLERVEVVTGGASAAYGSDAVSGVVNLILNDDLTGIRSSVEYGQAAEGDDETYVAKLAGGTGFWNDRAHWVGAVEFERNDGVGTCTERQWCADEVLNFGRPAGNTTLPANNILPDVRPSTISPTGVINSPGPLRGITFNPDGTPRRFVYGSLVQDLYMVGGEGEGRNGYFEGIPIKSPTKRYTLYNRFNVDLNDSVKAHFDIGYGNLEGTHASPQYRNVGANAVTVRRDNPFIPTSTNPALDIRTIMDANNIQSFALGRHYADIGNPILDSNNEMWRTVASFDGEFGKSSWGWDAYYQYGRNDFELNIENSVIAARATRALDATTNGAGQIVCRVNADTNPANDDPACVPLNPFGNQVAQGAIDYITGVSNQSNRTTEHVVAANVQGDLFPTWAGMTSVALGLEYRSDKVAGSTDPISRSLGFFTGNGQNISGKIEVQEGYIETAIPLAKDLPWARSVDLNGAIRRTQYDRSNASLSSDVDATTWKYGLVWEPIEWLRLRGTKSRDIRAPSVSELFGPITSGFGILTDPRTGLQTNPTVLSGSNATLTPEVADTWTAGFVLRPVADNWLGRLQLSVDYYEIDIDDSIGVLGAQTIALRCEQGATEFCGLITRNAAGVITQVVDTQQNVNQLSNSGTDLELAYRQPTLSAGTFDFRLLYSRVYHLITVDSAGPIDRAGQTGLRGGTIPGIPKYTADALVNWTWGPAQLSLHGRYIPSGIYNAAFIGPEQAGYSIALTNSTNLNDVPPALYLDTIMQYEFGMKGDSAFTVFGGVNNITDKQNPRRPGANGSGNNVLFDPVGRTYKVGFRYAL